MLVPPAGGGRSSAAATRRTAHVPTDGDDGSDPARERERAEGVEKRTAHIRDTKLIYGVDEDEEYNLWYL